MEALVWRQSTNGVEDNMHRPDRVGLCESAYWLLVHGVLLVTQSTSGFHEIASISTFAQAKEDKN